MEKKKNRETYIGFYLAACIILLLGYPTGSTLQVLAYYTFVLGNLGNAIRLARKTERKQS